MQHDRDRSGTVEVHELQQAIISWGYNLSPSALNIIMKRLVKLFAFGTHFDSCQKKSFLLMIPQRFKLTKTISTACP